MLTPDRCTGDPSLLFSLSLYFDEEDEILLPERDDSRLLALFRERRRFMVGELFPAGEKELYSSRVLSGRVFLAREGGDFVKELLRSSSGEETARGGKDNLASESLRMALSLLARRVET